MKHIANIKKKENCVAQIVTMPSVLKKRHKHCQKIVLNVWKNNIRPLLLQS